MGNHFCKKCIIICFSLLIQKVAMRALGFDVKKADILKILKDYDREATGKITFEDFNEVGVYFNSLCNHQLLENYLTILKILSVVEFCYRVYMIWILILVFFLVFFADFQRKK